MMQNKEKEAAETGRWATAAAAGPGDVVRKANAQGRTNRRMSGAVGNGDMECGKQKQGCTGTGAGTVSLDHLQPQTNQPVSLQLVV